MLASAGLILGLAFQPSFFAPEIHGDQSVTFTLTAPAAQIVSVRGDWMAGPKGLAITRQTGGVWTLTTAPLPAGVYLYCFWVDGLRAADPLNRRVKNGYPGLSSFFEVAPAPPAARGVTHVHFYTDKHTGRQRRAHVHTPPSFRRDGARLPVLYLLHGSSDSDRDWLELGGAGEILDRLIADGRAVPMVLAMPDGHPYPSLDVSTRAANLAELGADLTDTLMPLLEREYRVASAPKHRAIAGLSMGGAQAIHFGVAYPTLFGLAGGFSAPSDIPFGSTLLDALRLGPRVRKRPRFWLACGIDDPLLAEARRVHAELTSSGIASEWHETGGAHDWATWRGHLAMLAPLLFRR